MAGSDDDDPDSGQPDPCSSSGANPFSSVGPEGAGMFPKLAPRRFPEETGGPDESEADGPLADPPAPAPPDPVALEPLPSMESLPVMEIPPQAYSMGRRRAEAPPLPATTDARARDGAYGSAAAGGVAGPLGNGGYLRAEHGSVTYEPGQYLAGPDGESATPAMQTAESLTTDWLLHGRRSVPGPGWRRTVYRASGGLIRIGESSGTLRWRELVRRVQTPVAGGHHRVAVMSLKGGVGKTTTCVGLGATLASLRGDRVIAIDANPDRGTLSDKVRLETPSTVRDLLNESALISRYADVRAFTSQAPSRLEILASDRDPGVSIAFSADDYREVSRVLEHYYSVCITDCGTGLLHSAMAGILELADHIVLVSSPSVDGARSASATLDWLEAHQYVDLVRGAVVVLSTIRSRSRSGVDIDRLEAHFASRCWDVVRIPYDPHLEEGAEVDLDALAEPTREAYLRLAATVGDGFAVPRGSGAEVHAAAGTRGRWH